MALATSTLGPVRQTYASSSTFPSIGRAYSQISNAVKDLGLLRRAGWFYSLVALAIACGFGGAITGMVLLGDSWFQLLMAGALGILFTQSAFLAHEAGHRQVLGSGRANDWVARLVGPGVVGMSYDWWDSKHSRHHANPNRVGKDPDIEIDTISFLEVDAASARGLRKLITHKQGYLFFPLLAFEGINLHFLSLKHLLQPGQVKYRWLELALIVLRLAAVIVPVFLFMPLGLAFAFLGVQSAVFGIYMGASFAPNHKGMAIIAPDARLDFFTKQVRTSRNVRGGWWATVLMGGLNYQIEHHLFPSMARPYLSQAREVVMEFCRTLNVPYTEKSLVASYGDVIAYLNRVGLAAGGDPFDCPMVTQYRRV